MGKAKEELAKIIPKLNDNARARNMMEVWPRVMQFKFEDEETPFHIAINHGQIELKDGEHNKPDIVMSGNAEQFAQVVSGKKDVTHPLLFGGIKLKRGRNLEMITFSRILSTINRKWGS